LSWEEIKKSEWFNKLAAEKTDSFSKKLLADPEASGVDLKGGGFTIFGKKQGRGGYVSFQGSLKDAAAFEAFLKESHKDKVEIAKSGDLNYALMGDDGVITWNKSKFIVVGDAPMGSMNPLDGQGYGRSGEKFSTDSLLIFAKDIYALKGDALLDNNKKFADLAKSDGDMHFFLSMENLYNGMAGAMMSLMKVSTLLEDNITTATLSFDDGKITVDGHQYMNKQLTDLMNKFKQKEVTSELVNRLPSGDVLFAMALDYPMDAIVEIIKLSGADGMVNGALGEKGITLADIPKALTGQFLLALPSITKTQQVMEYQDYNGKKMTQSYPKTEVGFVGGVGINDQATFDKLYSVFMDMARNDSPQGVSIRNEKKWLVASNSNDHANNFFTGNNKPVYADKISGHSFGMYVNVNKIISSVSAMESGSGMDSISKAMLDVSLATWQDGTAYGDYKDGVSTFHMEMNLSDKKLNSLKQINQYADKMSALDNARREKMYDYQILVDSTSVVMPPAAVESK
jgi:hypothetical protein